MALRMFGDVAEQDAEGRFQALAADVARFVEHTQRHTGQLIVLSKLALRRLPPKP